MNLLKIRLPLAFASGFSLLFAFYARLFVMFTFTDFLEDATTGALPLKSLERTFQGLIFANTYLGHCYPSPRSSRPDFRGQTDGRHKTV